MKTNDMRLVRARPPRCRGFTLIELAVVLVVLGLIAALIVELFPSLTDRIRLNQTDVEITDVDEAVVGFALENNRLPCPDTNSDGFEGDGGCGAADVVGRLPYRDLGLPGPALDKARLPLRYGVYRNSGDDADLARLEELFEPALPDALDITAGTVTGCNETLDPPQTIIIYDQKPDTTLRVDVVSGTFQDEEYVGFLKLDLINQTAVAPPAPLESPLDTGESLYCPCGTEPDMTLPFPYPPKCSICLANFGTPKFTVGLEAHSLTSDTAADQPVGVIKDVFGSTVYAFPGGGFDVGNTVYELYNPNDIIFNPQPTRDVEDPATDDPMTPTYDPTGTTSTDNLLSGVSGEVDAVEEKSAFVVENGVSIVDLDTVDLLIEVPRTGAPVPFSPGDRVYGASSGAVGTVVSQTTTDLAFDDTAPTESVTSSSGGTATILADSDTGSSFVVDGSISGTIEGFDESGNPGDTITGDSTGTVADVIKVVTSDSSTPMTSRGSISFTPTVSGQTNELDFCQGLRNAIVAAGDTGSTSFVHTVNEDAVAINPAYLLVSGGVEDANGNGLDGSFDQRNEITTIEDFESPARLRDDSSSSTAVYDDLVATKPMNVLAERLACARNIGAVNALAVDATVQRNLAELAFSNNEIALETIELAFRGRELAQLSLELKAAQLALDAAGLAITIYQAIADFEGAASIAAVAASIAALAVAIADLVIADNALDSADSTYAGACTSQVGTQAALVDAIMAAEDALNLALRADASGGAQ